MMAGPFLAPQVDRAMVTRLQPITPTIAPLRRLHSLNRPSLKSRAPIARAMASFTAIAGPMPTAWMVDDSNGLASHAPMLRASQV